MKKNILIIISVVLVGTVGFVVYKTINKNEKAEEEKNIEYVENQNTNNYNCIIEADWTNFDKEYYNGNFLGKYKRTTTFSFGVLVNKYIVDTYYEEKLEFENIDGYAYLELDDIYEKKYDKEKFVKTYYSDSIIPILFPEGDSETNEVDYLSSLEELGYTCTVK